MTDRETILDLANRYAFAVDTQRWDLFDGIFAPDCCVDFGSGACWQDLATFKADFAAFHDPFDATQHVMSNHQILIDGDHASSFIYGTWRLIRHAAGDPLWDGSGWYDDEWQRFAQGWRITRRCCRVVWYTGNNKVREIGPDVTFVDERTSMRAEADRQELGYLRALSAAL